MPPVSRVPRTGRFARHRPDARTGTSEDRIPQRAPLANPVGCGGVPDSVRTLSCGRRDQHSSLPRLPYGSAVPRPPVSAVVCERCRVSSVGALSIRSDRNPTRRKRRDSHPDPCASHSQHINRISLYRNGAVSPPLVTRDEEYVSPGGGALRTVEDRTVTRDDAVRDVSRPSTC